MIKRFIILNLLLFIYASAYAQQNLFKGADVFVSTANKLYPGTAAVDGMISRESTWISATDSRPPHILEVRLKHYVDIDSITIYTGIPEEEKSIFERGQAAGFWSVKNFVIQYWDDANWTDLPETLRTENRSDMVTFHFPLSITAFRFRLFSTDGEPIRIIEMQGYGKINQILTAPSVPLKRENNLAGTRSTHVNVKITRDVTGQSMKYVGYNQGYYMPNSNVSGWVEYSGVNSVRLWASLATFVPEGWVDTKHRINTLAEFEDLRRTVRSDPLESGFIEWDSISAIASQVVPSTNTMVMDYALSELKRLGIDVILQVSNKSTDTSWYNKWKLWQRYYALAFYSANKGNVQMFAMQNEPNHRHAGPMPLDIWIELMKVVSDAVHCAVYDVNRLYKKELRPQFIGPVTAGTNTNWWAQIAAAERVDYKGAKCDHDLIELFSTHSYNLPAAGYLSKVQSIDQILRENHPLGHGKPILFTEIGRWMNAYLIDKEETMDSPSLFTEWAGIYNNIMKGGGYGMWAFKFANTDSETYPRGIKSGHHHIWKGKRFYEDAYTNMALGKPVKAIGTDNGHLTAYITDNDKSDESSWTFTSDGEKWIEIDLEQEMALGGMIIYTGSSGGVFTAPDRIRSLKAEFLNGSGWEPVPDAFEDNSRYAQLWYAFEDAIKTSKIRIRTNDSGQVKIREVKIFGANALSSTSESYDVSGVQRTAQVVRLFAKGFKDQRPLLQCSVSVNDADLDVCASVDSLMGNIYVWLVQRNLTDYNIALDLSDLGIQTNTPVVYEQVGHNKYGEASVLQTTADGMITLVLPKQSVGLLTINLKKNEAKKIFACKSALVRTGAYAGKNLGVRTLAVELDASTPENNRVSFVSFSADKKDVDKMGRIIFGVHGSCMQGEEPFRFHVYCMDGKSWQGQEMSWGSAPCLNSNEAIAERVGTDCFVAGELTMDSNPAYHYLDVTDVVKRHILNGIVFMLIREGREPGDDYDKGRITNISSHESGHPPILEMW